eukprot:1701344-Rhodomonas_salina.4
MPGTDIAHAPDAGQTITSLNSSTKLSWGSGYTPSAIRDSYGMTFGGEGEGKKGVYGTGQSQKVCMRESACEIVSMLVCVCVWFGCVRGSESEYV